LWWSAVADSEGEDAYGTRGEAGGTGVEAPDALRVLEDERRNGVLAPELAALVLACRASPAPLRFSEETERGGKGNPIELCMFCDDCDDCMAYWRYVDFDTG
jgi:hypothetical protein